MSISGSSKPFQSTRLREARPTMALITRQNGEFQSTRLREARLPFFKGAIKLTQFIVFR